MQKRVLSTALALVALTTLGACGKDADDKKDTVAVPAASATSGGDISTTNTMAAPMDSTHAGMSSQSPTGAATKSPIDSAKTKKKP